MADIIGLAAGITALMEVSTKVISHTRKLIRAIKTAPKELHLIHIEVLTLNGILDSLQLLHDAARISQSSLEKLQGWNGLVEICRRTLLELDKIIDTCSRAEVDGSAILNNSWMQRQFKQLDIALQASRAKRLIEDVRRFTDLIKVALLQDFQYQMGQQTESLNAVARGVADVKTTLEVKELDDLLHWISPLNPGYRQSFHAARSLRYKGTCDWLLHRQEYTDWRDLSEDMNLCVSGPAGSGKTVLSAAVLQDLFYLRSERLNDVLDGVDAIPICIIYYYFDLRDAFKNTTTGLYDSLVRQLLEYNPLGYSEVLELAKLTHRAHPDPSEYIELITKLIRDVLAAAHIFLVIDGFDPEECNDFGNLLGAASTWTSDLQRLSCTSSGSEHNLQSEPTPSYNKGRFKILATCRTSNESKVGSTLQSSFIPVIDEPIVKDIRTYVHGLIHSMPPAATKAIGKDLLDSMVKTIVERSDNLFMQAKLHTDTITNLETVSEIEQCLTRLPRNQNDTYAALLLKILERWPDAHNRSVLRRMFLWLCQAKYCLSVPEFVAVTTLSITTQATTTAKSSNKLLPWEPEGYCHRRLGPFLNIDRRTSPPEINLPHVTMEEFLQGSDISQIAELRDFHIIPADAQRELAEFCLGLMGGAGGVYEELDVPLTERNNTRPNDEGAKESSDDEKTAGSSRIDCNNVNPFKELPGGLSSLNTPLDPTKSEWIAPLQDRLDRCPGLEYASINWHHHLRNAFILTGQQIDGRKKRMKWLEETVVPMMWRWFLNGTSREQSSGPSGKGGGRYKSWCEAHAYFCHDLEEDCQCGNWQEPSYFLKLFGLRFLLPYLGRSDHVAGKGEATRQVIRSRCSECEAPLAQVVVIVDDDGEEGADVDVEVELEREKCPPCLSVSSKPIGQCGRSFKLFQRPELKWKALKDLQKYGLAQPV
ncbi:hypothetical protein V8F33_000672 [Rhypophila sp. PSN 637]